MAIIDDETVWAKLDDSDVVRVCLLLVEEVVFMGREKFLNVHVHILTLLEDLYAWDAYPWREYMWTFFYQKTLNVIPKHVEMHLKLKNQAGKKMATYNLNGFVWALKLKETWLIGSLSYIKGEDVPFIQSVKPVENVDQAVAIDDHISMCPTNSNTLLEDVDSLFKEVIDVRPDLVGRVGDLRTKIVQTLAFVVSNKETVVGNVMSPDVSCLKPDKLDEQRFDDALQDNAEMVDTMDKEDGKFCLDDMSIGFEEDRLNREIKNKKVNLDQCIAYLMDAENNIVGLDTPLLKHGFGLVKGKRKLGPALQSPYEQQQPTTPRPEKRRTITSQLLQLQLNDDSDVADEELENIDSRGYTIEQILPFCEDLRRHKKSNLYKVIVPCYIKALMKKVKYGHSTPLFKLVWDPYGIVVDLEFWLTFLGFEEKKREWFTDSHLEL
nr:phospholipase-like protein [Tanacetum cinerariifolium]